MVGAIYGVSLEVRLRLIFILAFDAGLGKHWIALTPGQMKLFPKVSAPNFTKTRLFKKGFYLAMRDLRFIIPTLLPIGDSLLVSHLTTARLNASVFSCQLVYYYKLVFSKNWYLNKDHKLPSILSE